MAELGRHLSLFQPQTERDLLKFFILVPKLLSTAINVVTRLPYDTGLWDDMMVNDNAGNELESYL